MYASTKMLQINLIHTSTKRILLLVVRQHLIGSQVLTRCLLVWCCIYVEVNNDVENETIKCLGEVWTEGQRNERNRVNVIHEENKCVLSQKDYNI